MLRGVGCCWLKFENFQVFHATFCECCMMLRSFGQVRATMLRLGMRTCSIFNNTQHVATRRNRVAKRAQHVVPNSVAICCVQLLPSFDRSFQMLGQQCCDMLRSGVTLFFTEKLNVIFFLSDRHLTAVTERCAGKQRPPVQHNRELDDVTHGTTGGNGEVAN